MSEPTHDSIRDNIARLPLGNEEQLRVAADMLNRLDQAGDDQEALERIQASVDALAAKAGAELHADMDESTVDEDGACAEMEKIVQTNPARMEGAIRRAPLKDILDHIDPEDVVHATHLAWAGGGDDAENLVAPVDWAELTSGHPAVQRNEVLPVAEDDPYIVRESFMPHRSLADFSGGYSPADMLHRPGAPSPMRSVAEFDTDLERAISEIAKRKGISVDDVRTVVRVVLGEEKIRGDEEPLEESADRTDGDDDPRWLRMAGILKG